MTTHRSIRVISIVMAALIAAVTVLMLGPTPARADQVLLQPGELVVNGDAEQAATVGWLGTLGRATHDSDGYPGSVIVGPGGATGATYPGGNALFTGSGASSTATQTIDLSPSAAAIDNGSVVADLSAYIGGYATQRDNATLTYDFRTAAGTSVGTVTFGPVLPADRGNVSGFVHFSQAEPLPAGTRTAVLTISTERFIAPANDGYVDNVSLILDAPSPVATPDSASTPENVPVTVASLTNDIPGAGAALVPSSVRLLDGATPVTTLTTSAGTYQVDTTTGGVTFTPAQDFVGTAPAVPYRITDSSGQQAQSTITVTVTFVPNPRLSVVKSATPSDAAAFVAGTEVTYSFVVENTGNVTMNGIAIDETAFSGAGPRPTVACPQDSLAPGGQEVCTSTPYSLTQADVDSLSVSNTAVASGTADGAPGTVITSPDSTFQVPVTPAPAISLVKTVGPSTADAASDAVTYSFRVTNTGNVSVHGVGVTETAFNGSGTAPVATCPTTPLLPGQSLICAAPYTLTQADVDRGAIDNTATASATDDSGTTVPSADSTATLVLVPQPALTFAKTADRTTISAVGQPITYSFTVVNTGNVTLDDVAIDDTGFTGAGVLGPVDCPTTTVAPGDSLVCTADYTTVAADLANGKVSNTARATVDAPSGDPVISDPSTSTLAVELPAPPAPAGDDTPLASTGTNPMPLVWMGAVLAALGAAFLLARASRRRRS